MSTMLVPRSYTHSQRRPSNSILQDEKGAMKANRARVFSPQRKQSPSRRETIQEAERPRTPPIAVPQRKKSVPSTVRAPSSNLHTRSSNSTQSVRIKGYHADRRSLLPVNHRQDSLSPAVAALLAVTSIPPRPHHPSRRRSAPQDRKISIDELVEEWRKDDEDTPTPKYGSPMDVLLERPEDGEEEETNILDSSSDKDSRAISSRSLSSESMLSIPSLEADEQSLPSWAGTLMTPQSMRKEKTVSSPPKEDCVLDHPLLHFNLEEVTEVIETNTTDMPLNSKSKPRSSFKSNLTASLQALKSAAKSFSNFTAPSVPPDDLLTRSILSPRFTSEMRPKPLESFPTPALRRYLNPLSPTDLSMQLHDTTDFPYSDGPMIQLQTYERRGRNSRKQRRSGPDPRSEAGRALTTDPSVRQREPRENSDFLRVIVMEMNMRREGKLDAKAVGKARVWLPPRKLEVVEQGEQPRGSGVVPARWVGLGADDV